MIYNTYLKDKECVIWGKNKLYLVRGCGDVPLPGVFPETWFKYIVYIGSGEGCDNFIREHEIIAKKKKYNDEIVFRSCSQVVLKNGWLDNVYTLQVVPLATELAYMKKMKYDLREFCRLVSQDYKLVYRERDFKVRLLEMSSCFQQYCKNHSDMILTFVYVFISVLLAVLFFSINF